MAGLEAAIPDAAALVFACLGIALACPHRGSAGSDHPPPGPGLKGQRRWPPPPTPRPASPPHPAEVPRPTRTARFLLLVTERHGPLAALPLDAVAGIAADLGPQVDLNAGSARAALRIRLHLRLHRPVLFRLAIYRETT